MPTPIKLHAEVVFVPMAPRKLNKNRPARQAMNNVAINKRLDFSDDEKEQGQATAANMSPPRSLGSLDQSARTPPSRARCIRFKAFDRQSIQPRKLFSASIVP